MAGKGQPRKLTPIEESGVYEARKAGTSVVDIAYTYKISVRTVDRIVKRVEEEREVKADGK